MISASERIIIIIIIIIITHASNVRGQVIFGLVYALSRRSV
jgi:hypothetical protein